MKTLAQVCPQKLYVIADGPRNHVPTDRKKTEETRKAVEEGVTWDCEVIKIYAETNLSGPVRVPSAFDEIFSKEEQVIILEDDCIPDLSFFQFVDELLDQYKDDDRVGTVCGYNLEFNAFGSPIENQRKSSYFFSKYPASWGWATWRRVWEKFDHDLKDYEKLKEEKYFDEIFHTTRTYNFWMTKFEKLFRKEIRNWDYKLSYVLIKEKLLSIIPNNTLVHNVGLDGSGANYSKAEKNYVNLKHSRKVEFPLIHPTWVEPDIAYDKRVANHFFSSGLIPKIKRHLRNKLLIIR